MKVKQDRIERLEQEALNDAASKAKSRVSFAQVQMLTHLQRASALTKHRFQEAVATFNEQHSEDPNNTEPMSKGKMMWGGIRSAFHRASPGFLATAAQRLPVNVEGDEGEESDQTSDHSHSPAPAVLNDRRASGQPFLSQYGPTDHNLPMPPNIAMESPYGGVDALNDPAEVQQAHFPSTSMLQSGMAGAIQSRRLSSVRMDAAQEAMQAVQDPSWGMKRDTIASSPPAPPWRGGQRQDSSAFLPPARSERRSLVQAAGQTPQPPPFRRILNEETQRVMQSANGPDRFNAPHVIGGGQGRWNGVGYGEGPVGLTTMSFSSGQVMRHSVVTGTSSGGGQGGDWRDNNLPAISGRGRTPSPSLPPNSMGAAAPGMGIYGAGAGASGRSPSVPRSGSNDPHGRSRRSPQLSPPQGSESPFLVQSAQGMQASPWRSKGQEDVSSMPWRSAAQEDFAQSKVEGAPWNAPQGLTPATQSGSFVNSRSLPTLGVGPGANQSKALGRAGQKAKAMPSFGVSAGPPPGFGIASAFGVPGGPMATTAPAFGFRMPSKVRR
eukprot:gnl/TRDRNA2_/TRDRNA2_153323_c1_seq1.p1 gnl/TRDRNA2_/TRDRNA2_153323_c1~~gnl/TRDRNA2_/TRDRNA2_153323_c1_seq1.p1  ORF type:complete len:550 (+),score=78.28 gnl/TRDRNA2_/TRDRNA2_153323_c1_seq1:22-1671(+)